MLTAVPTREEEATMVDGEDRRVGEADRRQPPAPPAMNPWANPALWVSITGILLTVCIFMATLLLSELRSINANLTRGLVSDATTELRITALEKGSEKLENRIDTVEKAYQYDFNRRLPAIEAALNLKPPPKEGE
jgi:hypothetical protein